MKMRKVFMRVASLFLWVVMIISAACISFAAELQENESSVIETVAPETTTDGSEITETTTVMQETTTESTTENTVEETTTEQVKELVLIDQTADDIKVIPDKYNTGAKGELKVVELGATVEGIEFKASTNDTRNVVDFYYRNTDVEGIVVFKNYDFSNYEFWTSNEDKVAKNINFVFDNCKFSIITVGKGDSNLSYEFNNCTIARFVGSNAVLNNCKMGEGCASDGLVPYRNVEVNNCFFGNMSSISETGKEIHTDGTQIYGFKGIDVENVHYNNCRFEIPPILVGGSSVSVNACLMLQLEYSNGNNITFSDCVINGGSYSIFARGVKGCTMQNVKFERIRSGCAKVYGTLYSDISPAVEMYDFSETDDLYISSVWKDGKNTCISVTNDTNSDRKLVVITDCGEYQYTIPACPAGTEVVEGMTYADMPFDIKIDIPADCEYVVCYDATVEGAAKQIRFVNWGEDRVYLEKELVDSLIYKKDSIIAEGSCGKAVNYTLTASGILTLSGQGSTDNFHSAKLPPWSEYINSIKKIVIEEGITEIGTQIFRKCVAVQNVELPDGLEVIGQRAFAGCTSLTSITLPASVRAMGNSVFSSSVVRTIYYEGTNWEDVELGTGNENLASMVKYVNSESASVSNIVMQGICGKNAEYVLTEDGIFRITGEGEMYNYHSGSLPPWNEVKDMITTVIVEEGITSVGSQAFRKCNNISSVILPDGLEIIGNNAFSTCKLITELVIPRSVKEIHKYAFANISAIKVIYEGTLDEWSQIGIGVKNESITQNVICE